MLRVGPFQIDLDSHEASVICNGQQQALDLTLTEFKMYASMLILAL
jgi:two-component system response regulator AdeR